MTDVIENPIKVGGSILDGISLSQGKVKIRLALKNGIKELILTLTNVFYLLNSSSNLISLWLLNDVGIYHDNKKETLYNLKS